MHLSLMHVMCHGSALFPNDRLTLHNNNSCSRNSSTCSIFNRNLLKKQSSGPPPTLSLWEKRNATSLAWFSLLAKRLDPASSWSGTGFFLSFRLRWAIKTQYILCVWRRQAGTAGMNVKATAADDVINVWLCNHLSNEMTSYNGFGANDHRPACAAAA